MRDRAFVIAKFGLDESRRHDDISCDSATGHGRGEQENGGALGRHLVRDRVRGVAASSSSALCVAPLATMNAYRNRMAFASSAE